MPFLGQRTAAIVLVLLFVCFGSASEPKKGDLPQDNSFSCIFCRFMVELMKSYLSQDPTKQEILDLFSRICNYVSTNYTAMCESWVEEYGPALVQMLIDHIPAEKICIDLGICADNTTLAPLPPVMKATIALHQTAKSMASPFLMYSPKKQRDAAP